MNSKQNGGGCLLKMNGGGGHLMGSEYEGAGEVNVSNMLKSGTSYVSFDHSDSQTFSGSYPEVVKSVHQCGGKRRRSKNQKRSRTQTKQRKNKLSKSKSLKNKRQNKKNRSSKRRSTRKN
jgi:hypothetical protein